MEEQCRNSLYGQCDGRQLFASKSGEYSHSLGETTFDAGYHSIGYDSGICLSNYKSTESNLISRDATECISEKLRNLELTQETFKKQNTTTSSLNNSSVVQTTAKVQEPSFYEDQLFQQDKEGDTYLHLAIIKPDPASVFRMIEMTRIPEYLDIQNKNYQHTPLHLAVITDQPHIVRALIVSGASLSTRDRYGNTALHLACKQGSLTCIKQLTTPLNEEERKYILYLRNSRGMPMHMIRATQQFDINLMNYEGETCLHLALFSSTSSRTEIIDYIINCCGANINTEDGKCGYTILHQTVKAKDLMMVQFLLQYQQLAVNQKCYSGNTALDIAISLRIPQMEQLLRSSGALCSEPTDSDSLDQSDDNEVDEFDDLMIGGLRLNV